MEDKTRTPMDGKGLVNPTIEVEPHDSQVAQHVLIDKEQNKGDDGRDVDLSILEQGTVKRKALDMLLVSSNSISGQCEKKSRGRPRGSGKLQLLASIGGLPAETAGGAFTPHILTVLAGEDIVKKLMSLSQNVGRPVCILSANGIVSSVILCHPSSSGGTLRYEGLFEILNLSGPYKFGDIWTVPHKSSLLRVSLAKPNGGVFGGVVAGALIAGSHVQIVVGSFKQNIMKEFRMRTMAEASASSSKLGKSEINGLLLKETSKNKENCATPTTSLSERTIEEAGNTGTAHQTAIDDSQEVDGQSTLQSPKPISGEGLSPVINSDSAQK